MSPRKFNFKSVLAAGITLSVLLSGCTSSNTKQEMAAAAAANEQPVEIKVIGYGAPTPTFQNIAQRHLMSLRASEVDAYRKIGEQVAGVHLSGDTRVADYIAGNDKLRLQISAFIRGAAITSQDIRADGTAETNMILKVESETLRQMLGFNNVPKHGHNILPGTSFHEGVDHATSNY